MSYLQNKSEILSESAKFLHDKNFYPAVAHGAYYSCYQLLRHIWIYSMKKTEMELVSEERSSTKGSHGYLINQVISYIAKTGKKDCATHAREINSKISQLKILRTDADYNNSEFNSSKSSNSLYLSAEIIPVLKIY